MEQHEITINNLKIANLCGLVIDNDVDIPRYDLGVDSDVIIDKIIELGYNVERVATPTYKVCRIYRGEKNNNIKKIGVISEDNLYIAVTEFLKII